MLSTPRAEPSSVQPPDNWGAARDSGAAGAGLPGPSSLSHPNPPGAVSGPASSASGAALEETRKRGLPLPAGIYSLGRAFAFLEWQQKTDVLARELGSFLIQALPHPDHFVTLTLRDHLNQGTRIQLGFIALERAWQQFVRMVRKTLGHRFEFVYVVELQARGVPHIHALTWNTKGIRTEGNELELMIQDRCWNLFGMSRMAPFDPSIGNVGTYLTKYLFKGGTEKRIVVSNGIRQHAARTRNRTVLNAGNGAATT